MNDWAGFCDPRFGAVKDEFLANFARGDIGAACAVEIDGRVVVDLWGGWADESRTQPWERDTLVNAYSVGKPIVATSLLQCVASDRIELDAPATPYWPELTAGMHGATVRDALCHRAGVPAIREPLTNNDLSDWNRMCAALAATEPWWTPGTKHAYHVNTYGFLIGELARRVTGTLPGDWLRTEIAGPLDADLAWGLDAQQLTRCADVVWQQDVPPSTTQANVDELPDDQAMTMLGYFNPPGFSSLGIVNTTAWRKAQVPSTNLHATARGVARFYAALIDGRILDAEVLAEATRTQSEGWCPYLEREVSFGLGFQPTRPDRRFGPNAGSYGHFGTGGSVGFADPSASLAFGYVMNAVKPRWQSPRNRALIEAVYSCL